jgi:hypothetical protein
MLYIKRGIRSISNILLPSPSPGFTKASPEHRMPLYKRSEGYTERVQCYLDAKF